MQKVVGLKFDGLYHFRMAMAGCIDSDACGEVQKHISLTRHIYVAVPIVINEQFYKGLPEEYQQIISDAAKESVLYRRELLKTSEDKALADMKKSGIEVVTDPDIEAFAERAKAVWEEFVDGEVITWDLVNRVKDY